MAAIEKGKKEKEEAEKRAAEEARQRAENERKAGIIIIRSPLKLLYR